MPTFGDDSDGEESRRRKKKAEEDEEAAWLEEYEEEQQKQQVKERFWRRDAEFINDDEEEGEGGADGGSDSEALEEGERARLKPLEVGKMSSQQVYDMLHSESNRLLRKSTAALPCTKKKNLNIHSVLHKIEKKQAARAAPSQRSLDAEERDREEERMGGVTNHISCGQCGKAETDQWARHWRHNHPSVPASEAFELVGDQVPVEPWC